MSVGLLNKSSCSVRHRGSGLRGAWFSQRQFERRYSVARTSRGPWGHSVMKTPDSRRRGVDAQASAGSRSRRGEPRRLAGSLSNERDGDGLGGKEGKGRGTEGGNKTWRLRRKRKEERETVDGKHKTGGCGMAFGRGKENEETTERREIVQGGWALALRVAIPPSGCMARYCCRYRAGASGGQLLRRQACRVRGSIPARVYLYTLRCADRGCHATGALRRVSRQGRDMPFSSSFFSLSLN